MIPSRREAIERYRKKFDKATIYLPPGARDLIRGEGVSVSGICNQLLKEWATARGLDYPEVTAAMRPPGRPRRVQPEELEAAAGAAVELVQLPRDPEATPEPEASAPLPEPEELTLDAFL